MIGYPPVARLPAPERLAAVLMAVLSEEGQARLLPVVAVQRENDAEEAGGGHSSSAHQSMLT